MCGQFVFCFLRAGILKREPRGPYFAIVGMFGARGRAAVMALKRENLSRAPSYRIESVAAVDVRGGSVAAVFECLIPGREGRGVDVVRVADGKVVAVDALRF
tara:strand:- start:2 stop:307 length:306 start_codon:yes stop_codon:yes gene_type:complete